MATLAVAAVAVDGLPFWGADAGGPPALIAGFAILLYAARGRAITWRRFVTAGLIAVLLVALLGVADWLRPVDQRTHLGDYVQRVIDGTAWGVITDKASANLAILAGAVGASHRSCRSSCSCSWPLWFCRSPGLGDRLACCGKPRS